LALLALVLLFFVAPKAAERSLRTPASAVVLSPAAPSPAAPPDSAADVVEPAEPVADRTRSLTSQFAAAVRGSRAPPAARS
ncbi:MAG: hypothetical protein ABW046_05685, partial [Actinoplanes sp.]